MNYAKIDAALAAAIDQTGANEPRLVVFIHSDRPVGPAEVQALKSHGVQSPASGRQVVTTTLTPRAIEALSDEPWVCSIRLSSKLRPA